MFEYIKFNSMSNSNQLYENSQPKQGQPVQQQPQSVVIVQQAPINLFKTEPAVATCPSCQNVGATTVQTTCSCSNYLCYCWFGLCIWAIYQCCRDKGYNCKDASHYCSSCYALIATYQAC